MQAHEKHRKFIEKLPRHSYPLDPVGAAEEVPLVQSNTGKPLEQR